MKIWMRLRRRGHPEVRPSQRKELLDRAAVMIGLEPGGRCTGWLEMLWDHAYEEGQRDARLGSPHE